MTTKKEPTVYLARVRHWCGCCADELMALHPIVFERVAREGERFPSPAKHPFRVAVRKVIRMRRRVDGDWSPSTRGRDSRMGYAAASSLELPRDELGSDAAAIAWLLEGEDGHG